MRCYQTTTSKPVLIEVVPRFSSQSKKVVQLNAAKKEWAIKCSYQDGFVFKQGDRIASQNSVKPFVNTQWQQTLLTNVKVVTLGDYIGPKNIEKSSLSDK